MKKNRLFWFISILFFSAKLLLAQQSKLQIYGFFDMEAEVSNKNAAAKRWTFDQHHLNIITIYHLDGHFRVFSEIEWEHGPSHKANESAGTIYLARSFLEYKHSDAFEIRAGKFLPPFGIYNERHDATPSFLSTVLPITVYGKHANSVGKKDRLYAKLATGIWGLGAVYVKNWRIAYHLYLSNGRGPEPDETDNNVNKGIGGRLIIRPPISDFRLGISYYSDRDGNAFNTRQSAFGVDAEFDRSNLELKTELFIPRGEKVDANEKPNGVFQQGAGFYVQGGYTFLDQITPFARFDFFDPDTDKDQDGETHFVLGLNYSVNTGVYLKAETHFVRFQEPTITSYEMFIASIAVAF